MSLTAEQLGITWEDCEKIIYNASAKEVVDDYRIFMNRMWTIPLTVKQIETVTVQLAKHNDVDVNEILANFIEKKREYAKDLERSLNIAELLMNFNAQPDSLKDKLMWALSYEKLPVEDAVSTLMQIILKAMQTLGERWLTDFYFWLTDDAIHDFRMANYNKWGGVISNLRGENYYCKQFFDELKKLDKKFFTNDWANMILKHALTSCKFDIEYAAISFVEAHPTGMYVVLLQQYQRMPEYKKRPYYIKQTCEDVVNAFMKKMKD